MNEGIRILLFIFGSISLVTGLMAGVFKLIKHDISNNRQPTCIEWGVVISVGGCNGSGVCGVMTNQFAYAEAKLPVEGQAICVRYEGEKSGH